MCIQSLLYFPLTFLYSSPFLSSSSSSSSSRNCFLTDSTVGSCSIFLFSDLSFLKSFYPTILQGLCFNLDLFGVRKFHCKINVPQSLDTQNYTPMTFKIEILSCYGNIRILIDVAPTEVAARSEAWSVFVSSNTGIVGSNPTQGMDVYAFILCLC
jgi:hypothetical protein